jgi:hypothetical protein
MYIISLLIYVNLKFILIVMYNLSNFLAFVNDGLYKVSDSLFLYVQERNFEKNK